MRATAFYSPTLRQAPADAETAGHQLLLRGGFVRQLSAGAFSYLPLGLRVLRRLERLVREEMEAAGALETLLPMLQPAELWDRSGRLDSFSPPLLSTKDRSGHSHVLAPTHEEAATDLAAQDLTSYKQLPLVLYQIQQKFRDELRPRAGLARAREFLMKDAYSFDSDTAGLDRSCARMQQAYARLFERLALEVVMVEATAGAMGGYDTREFILPTPTGEDTILRCAACGYAANVECARSGGPEAAVPRRGSGPSADGRAEPRLVTTPQATTIEAVTALLAVPAEALIKTLLLRGASGFVAALVRGDRQLNEAKLQQVVGEELRLAEPEEIRALTGAEVGFSGPVGLVGKARLVADEEIAAMAEAVVGANQTDAHLTGVVPGVHFVPDVYTDLRLVVEGDPCPRCAAPLRAERGLELGHLFKLGTRYAEALGALVQDETGHRQPLVMGCYGLGVSRCLAAVAEVWHDEAGLVWPPALAPFEVAILLLDPGAPEIAAVAEGLYQQVQAAGCQVLLDDRDERPGVKFKDADLIGYPVVVVAGKRTGQEGLVEVRRRRDRAERAVPPAEAPAAVQELLATW